MRRGQQHAIAAGFLATGMAAVTQAAGTSYPNRPIRAVVATAPGGALDAVMRILSPKLTDSMGQTWVVDNRSGASGNVGAEIVARANADGYTVLTSTSTLLTVNPALYRMSFNIEKDLQPVTLLASGEQVVVVHPGVQAKTLAELIALAKQKPGALNYATSGVGNSNHIAGELFRAMAGVDIVRVNYRGAAVALTDVVSGRVELMFATANASQPHIQAGRLTALGVTSSQPSPVAPGLPTVAAAGGAALAGYESAATIGVLARAGTPPAVVNLLHREIVRYMRTPDAKERLLKAGIEAVGNTPAEFAAIIRADMTIKGKVIREAGIRMD